MDLRQKYFCRLRVNRIDFIEDNLVNLAVGNILKSTSKVLLRASRTNQFVEILW